MPVQRLPRYEMLMKTLLDVTGQSHVDYANLNQSLVCPPPLPSQCPSTLALLHLARILALPFASTGHAALGLQHPRVRFSPLPLCGRPHGCHPGLIMDVTLVSSM